MNALQQLDQGEYIVYEARKHWLILGLELATLAFLAFVPVVVFVAFYNFFHQVFTDQLILIILFFYTFWLLILWILIFMFWTDYYLDVWIITNKKLIDIEQKGIFSREISTLTLENVQDVTVEIKGFIQTWMNYGDVHVQTGAAEREFIMHGIANPHEMRRVLTMAWSSQKEMSEVDKAVG